MSPQLIDTLFVGRQYELDLIGEAFRDPSPKLIGIFGDYGTGKTALAIRAAKTQYADNASVHYVQARQHETLIDTVQRDAPPHWNAALLIVDELEHRPAFDSADELKSLRDRFSATSVIAVSTLGAPNLRFDLRVELRALRNEEIESFGKLLLAQDYWPATAEAAELAASLSRVLPSEATPRELARLLRGFRRPGLVSMDGRPLHSASAEHRQIVVDIAGVNDKLLERAHADPNVLHQITPRRFEEFVAELLDRLGYQVTLTPVSRDGGIDIYAARKDALGSFLYVVECKRYAPRRPVQVDLIRHLYGVVQAERATAGILATTSYFTKGAMEFQRSFSHQITLRDFAALRMWIDQAMGSSASR